MISSRKQLRFYLQADMMMNRGYFKESLKKKLLHLMAPDYIMEFLKAMRKVQYYSHNCQNGGILLIINKTRFFRLSRKLGFSIGYDACDYGLVIPHYGTIVVGNTTGLVHTQHYTHLLALLIQVEELAKVCSFLRAQRLLVVKCWVIILLLLPIRLSQSLSQKVMLC